MRHLNADRTVVGHDSTMFKVVHSSYTLVPLWSLVNAAAKVELYKKSRDQNFVMCLVSRAVYFEQPAPLKLCPFSIYLTRNRLGLSCTSIANTSI
jgi:hypothetical protein